MKKVKVFIRGISPSRVGRFFDIFLQEEDGQRMLSIQVGEFEAQRLAIEMDKINTPRPLTYDLFYNMLNSYNIIVKEVIIARFHEGTYCSNIVCSQSEEEKVFDGRTSDALNMALKHKSPIFASEEILDKVGFLVEEIDYELNQMDNISFVKEKPIHILIEEFESLLSSAIEEENYDLAAKIRDEISALKEKNKDKND